MVIRLFLVLKSFKMRPQTMAFLFNCRLNKIKQNLSQNLKLSSIKSCGISIRKLLINFQLAEPWRKGPRQEA